MAEKRKVANLMALAVLATVVQRPMHRYEMASLMRARGKERDMGIKWGSLYTVVQNLERSGYVEAIGVSRQGARPERTVYQITDAGRDELVAWTRELIAEPEAEHTRFIAGLSVLAVLAPQDVIDLLRTRLERLSVSIDALTAGLEQASHQATLSASGDLTEAAANLFGLLRSLDRADVVAIAVAPIPSEGLGEAIQDRLARAAAER